MQRLVLILLVVVCCRLCAQKEDYTWVAGLPPVKMDFTDTGFTFDPSFSQPTNYNFFNTSFTENDSAGNLLFFTDGASVYDRHGDIMENGTGLNPSAYLTQLDGGNGFMQAAMGAGKPGSDSLYYLFHFGVSDSCPGYPVELGGGVICKLFLSIIDINGNNGLGTVIEKNHVLMQDTVITGTEMTLIKHGNGKDWWLIKHGGDIYNRYYKFLVTADSITGPFTQDLGSFPNRYSGTFGTATISPDGTKFAGVTGGQNINIFDFDRCTGMFSNPDTFAILDSLIEDTLSFGTSLAFSPDSRFLYVDYPQFINQYDLHAADINGSKYTLITLSDTSRVDSQFLQMQLAPDGKIYIGPYDGRPFISVICQPDSPGASCRFSPCSIYMPCSQVNCDFWGLPMFPQYRLPTIECTTGIPQIAKQLNIKYYPYLYVYDMPPQTQLQVYNLLGQLVYSSSNYQNDWDVRKVVNAMYVFQLGLPDGTRYSGKVAVVH